MNTTTNQGAKVTIECGRCAGSGRYYYNHSETGPCFGCSGRGKVTMSAAKHEKLLAGAARMAAAMAAEAVVEAKEAACYGEAFEVIDALGLAGARRYFAANRSDMVALGALVGAMRDHGMQDEANALVRHRNAAMAA